MAKVLVLGLGVSGKGVARLLLKQGHTVMGIDEKSLRCPELEALGVRTASSLEGVAISEYAFAVVSPGISPQSPTYSSLVQSGVKIVGEAAYCLEGAEQALVGITGSNGKTTVTLLVAHALRCAGKKSKAVGNVGLSFGETFLNPDPQEILVAELSSFQLEHGLPRVFDAGIILNCTPNHLDRHATLDAYAHSKLQLALSLKENAPLWLHPTMVPFVVSFMKEAAFAASFPYFLIEINQEIVASFEASRYRTWAKHDRENAHAAWLLCSYLGVGMDAFIEALETFKKPAHRIEYVATIDGVHYFNDSKASTPEAVMAAVDAMSSQVVLIAGGLDKGCSFASWGRAFCGRVKKVLAIGAAAPKICREIGKELDVEEVGTLDRAVAIGAAIAKEGECVLLSAGCASYDQFKDYCHRGDVFKQLVERRRNP